MARYRIAHYPRQHCWMIQNPDGSFVWYEGDDAHERAHLFKNYREAWAALESLPDEKLMYGESYRKKCHFMKAYDSEEHFQREQAYLANKRDLKSWGY